MLEIEKRYLEARLREWEFRGYSRLQVFDSMNLPDPSKITPNPTVVLTREKMNEFRDAYRMLSTFIECVIGKQDFCALDLMAYMQKEAEKPAPEPREKGGRP